MAQNPFSAVVRVAGFRDFGKFLRHEIDGVFSFASACCFPAAERDGRLLSAPLPVVQFASLPCRRRLPGTCDIGTVCFSTCCLFCLFFRFPDLPCRDRLWILAARLSSSLSPPSLCFFVLLCFLSMQAAYVTHRYIRLHPSAMTSFYQAQQTVSHHTADLRFVNMFRLAFKIFFLLYIMSKRYSIPLWCLLAGLSTENTVRCRPFLMVLPYL